MTKRKGCSECRRVTILILIAIIVQFQTPHCRAQTTNCSPPYKVDWPANNPVWSFCWIPPDNSSGIDGSGLELRDVFYKGKCVLRQAAVPVLNVKYDPGGCGDDQSLSYRDWQSSGMLFEADNVISPGYAEPTVPPRTVCDHPGTDVGQFYGVAAQKLPDRLILTTEMQAGHYRYVQTWTFYLNGIIEPRFAFTALIDPCTTKPHNHHVYWRFDFDIDGPPNNVIEELQGSTWKTRLTETKRKNAHGRIWRVMNTGTHRGYIIQPGLMDGVADQWAVADMWALLFHPNEIDDGGAVTGLTGNAVQLDRYLNNENIKGRNVALWTHAMWRHAGGIGCHMVGPTLKPVGSW